MNSGVPSPLGVGCVPSAVAVRPVKRDWNPSCRPGRSLRHLRMMKPCAPFCRQEGWKSGLCPLAMFKAVGLEHGQVVTQVAHILLALTRTSLEVWGSMRASWYVVHCFCGEWGTHQWRSCSLNQAESACGGSPSCFCAVTCPLQAVWAAL